ncbi:MAG: UDP-N-acetylmuramoyl-L-alanyl-D-glutamate--2,6-diaminopimelate ligase [Candidatus Dadabacteria bacterium]|nr:UDP-N-acetylmuramoyl-L-alanyl-D-glutamate--2,6-diaminopimelate ligase [Candidatus Dadabacteria bacterium]NIQ15328.1 UDP-N-acetylmuramoyl-L-alanyl-D-glutamate--2,6-diaminopimelate ligase [Candidatus Dadabacteria bacterium]
MKLRNLLNNVDIKKISGSENIEIKGITIDSNKVEEGYMFVAIRGKKIDGHKFASSAVKNGAVALMVEELTTEIDQIISVVEVENTRDTLPYIASNFYNNPTNYMTVVGITGTNGKTSISYMLEEIWKQEGKITGVIGTIENRYKNKVIESDLTTPDAIELNKLLFEMKSSGVTHAAMEVSSHALDLKRVDSCNFDVAVFTNLTQDHLDYHQNIDEYYEAKKRLFTEVLTKSTKSDKYSVINIDDPFGLKLYNSLKDNVINYSIRNKKATIYAENIDFKNNGISADIKSGYGNIKINSKLIGQHNLYNLMAAAGTALSLGSSIESINTALNNITHIPGRLEKISNNLGINVIVDYAHTPDALENVIKSLKAVYSGRIITVVGCGGDRDKKKRPLMGNIGHKYSDLLIVTSDNPRTENPDSIIDDIFEGIETDKNRTIRIVDREKAIEHAINSANRNDTILIAGKGHEDYQIIGKEKRDFDDRLISKNYLKLRENTL